MAKQITFTMSKQIMEMALKPLRSKIEAVLLILNTIRMFDISVTPFVKQKRREEVVISIDKMRRVFYLLENKCFSMHFPFFVKVHGSSVVVYDVFHTQLTPLLLSCLIEIFESMERIYMDFDAVFEMITNPSYDRTDFSAQEIWMIVSYLLQFELGYLRYDIDFEHECGKNHPLNHLDVCLAETVSYKLGLEHEIGFDDFRDILDVTTECWYIKQAL